MGGWQKRVEIAQYIKKQQKYKKLTKDQRSIYKALIQNELWPLLDQFKGIKPDLPLGKMHVWVDIMPGASQKKQSTADEVYETSSTSRKNNKQKKGKSKSDASPAAKKHHPRSHEHEADDSADDDEPLLCHEYFFTGRCQGLNKSGGKSKKGCLQCDLVHPSKKELTLAAALKANTTKGSKAAKQLDTGVNDVLKRSSTSALATQKKLDGDDIVVEEDSPLSESAGIDMLYHLEVPLLVEGAANNISELVTNLLGREKVAVSSIAYVVYDNVLLFDRCDGGKVISPESEATIFETIDDNNNKENAKSDSFITFPATVLEHILMYLPGSYSGLLPMVCKSLHAEIGTHSPALWKQLIAREGWTEPGNVQADPMALYKSYFISHDRICQRVDALKVGVTKLLRLDNEIEISRGTVVGGLNEYLEDLGSTAMHVWDEHSMLVASQNDCMVHLHKVSKKKQSSSDDKCLREIMQVRLAPVPISKKTDCTLTNMAIDDRYVLFSFDVDGRSILSSIMKDELLSNSTEDTIECGDFLKKHELPLLMKDYYDRNQDDDELVFLSDLETEVQSFENDLTFNVLDLKEVGHGIFCVLVKIYFDFDLDLDEEDEDNDELSSALLSFSASNGREAILDCIRIPTRIASGSPLITSNIRCKQRSDPVEIVCKSSQGHEIHVTNMDRSGSFHQKMYLHQDNRTVPAARAANMPTYSSHTLRTSTRLVGYSEIGGSLDVYELKEDAPPKHLPLHQDFNTVLSMNHLDNDYVLMICRRDAESLPAEEDIDGHWFEDDHGPKSDMYCLYFIVIYIPSMEEIYVSRIISAEKVDMMVAIGKDHTVAAAVGGAGCCFSSPFVVTKALDEDSNIEWAPRQKKVKKKKPKVGAKKEKKEDGFTKKFCNKR